MRAGQTQNLLGVRADLARTILLAVMVSIGTNLISSGVSARALLSPDGTLIIGAVLIFVSMAAFVYWFVPRVSGSFDFDGVVTVLRGDSKEPVRVDRYRFSEEFCRSIRALLAENKAYDKMWRMPYFAVEEGHSTPSPTHSALLATEAIEYFVIEELSTHLGDYFNKNKNSADDVITFYRNDVPELFIHNRFIDLFSRPMEEREAFSKEENLKKNEIVVAAFGNGGVIFSRFDLTLPKGTKISRKSHGNIKIATKRFNLIIECDLSRFTAVTPRYFDEVYLQKDMTEIDSKKAKIKLSIKFNPLHFLTPSGWQYYKWLDSFLDKIESKFSFEKFIDEIQWHSALTVAKISSNTDSMRSVAPSRQRKKPELPS